MSTNFFRNQERARKKTGLLLFYFFLAIFLTIVAVNAVFYFASAVYSQPGISVGAWLAQPYGGWITVITLLVVCTGSLTKYLRVRSGSRFIAESVGARLVSSNSTDARERVLLNVVEEMAIASGTPAPMVYVMDDEPGINAFVAGFEPTEAILVVTRGALDTFNRDELQGVIGHEFSHILNGDMRLNVQLYAMLGGILAIGRVGEFLLRGGRYRYSYSSDGSSRNRSEGAFMLLGVALLVIGYIGLFFGRLIKAAISREREWLADASSVQFTRNPSGIGEALLKIRNAANGSLLMNAHAEDMSHMCFAMPMNVWFSSLLATHPPLDARIAAIDKSLLARDRARHYKTAREAEAQARAAANADPLATPGSSTASTQVPAIAPPAMPPPGVPLPFTSKALPADMPLPFAMAPIEQLTSALKDSVGVPGMAHLEMATSWRKDMPDTLRDALRNPDGARAVIYAIILIDSHGTIEAEAQTRITNNDGAHIAAQVPTLISDLRKLGTRLFLPCMDLALPALRTLQQDQRARFIQFLEVLVRLDARLTVREYLILVLMRKHLDAKNDALRRTRFRSYSAVGGQVNTVISLLCHATGANDAEKTALHARLIAGFGSASPTLMPMTSLGARQLQLALTDLADLSPLLKKPLLDACIDCVQHDGKLQVAEIELVRAIGDALDCPVPPLAGMPA